MRAASMTVARSSAVGASSSARAAAPARRGAAVVAAPIRTAGVARNINNSNSNKRSSIPPARALELDWSDPDTLIGALGGVLGLLVGIGAPLFYISRDKKDEERLDELRALNRKTFEETGEYMTEEEIRAFRQPRWTDRREFQDDD